MAIILIIERAFCVRREGAGAGSYPVLFTHLHVHVLGQVRPSFRMLVSPTDNRLLYYHFLLVEYASLSINSPCTTRTRPVPWYRKDASPAPPPPVSPEVKRLAFRTVSSASSTPPYTSFARLKVSGKPTRVVHHKRV